jgi:hypothetical protein
LNELNESQKQALREWWYPEYGDNLLTLSGKVGNYEDGVQVDLPLLSIGQMVEFLGKRVLVNYLLDEETWYVGIGRESDVGSSQNPANEFNVTHYYQGNPCDALWEAVKQELGAETEPDREEALTIFSGDFNFKDIRQGTGKFFVRGSTIATNDSTVENGLIQFVEYHSKDGLSLDTLSIWTGGKDTFLLKLSLANRRVGLVLCESIVRKIIERDYDGDMQKYMSDPNHKGPSLIIDSDLDDDTFIIGMSAE